MNCEKTWRALAVPLKFLTISSQLHESQQKSGEAQRLFIRQFPHFQRRQAGTRPGPHLILHFFSMMLLEAKEDL